MARCLKPPHANAPARSASFKSGASKITMRGLVPCATSRVRASRALSLARAATGFARRALSLSASPSRRNCSPESCKPTRAASQARAPRSRSIWRALIGRAWLHTRHFGPAPSTAPELSRQDSIRRAGPARAWMVGGIQTRRRVCQQLAGLILRGFTPARDRAARSGRRHQLRPYRSLAGFQCPLGCKWGTVSKRKLIAPTATAAGYQGK